MRRLRSNVHRLSMFLVRSCRLEVITGNRCDDDGVQTALEYQIRTDDDGLGLFFFVVVGGISCIFA